jgi:hypothetical protein
MFYYIDKLMDNKLFRRLNLILSSIFFFSFKYHENFGDIVYFITAVSFVVWIISIAITISSDNGYEHQADESMMELRRIRYVLESEKLRGNINDKR